MCIEVLVGMIASGKSTYAAKRAKEGAVIVNDDAIVLAVHGGDYSLYDEKLKKLYKAIQLNMITSAILRGRDVVVDSTNRTVKTRQRYLRLAESFDVPCVAVVFPRESEEVHARRRVESDARGLTYVTWLDVAKKHAVNYVAPTEGEGFHEIRRVA